MKKKEFINKLKQVSIYGVQKFFEPDNDGSCPCFQGKVKLDEGTLQVWGRCWRVSKNAQDLHVWGTLPKKDNKEIAEIIKKKLDKQKWYNPYTIMGK